jgi:hypothetical protein
MLETNFHVQPDDTVRCTGASGSVFITATAKSPEGSYRPGPRVSLFISVAQAREVHAQMGKAIAEHDLIAKAKADAAQSEAA